MKNNLKSNITTLKPVCCGCGMSVSLEIDRLIQENERVKGDVDDQ